MNDKQIYELMEQIASAFPNAEYDDGNRNPIICKQCAGAVDDHKNNCVVPNLHALIRQLRSRVVELEGHNFQITVFGCGCTVKQDELDAEPRLYHCEKLELLRTRLQQVEGLLVTTTQQRDAVQALYDAGLVQWEPVYKLVLDERDSLRAALQQAEAEREGFRGEVAALKAQAVRDDERVNALQVDFERHLAALQREREEWQVALQAAERKITRLEEQRVGIKRPV